jgi:hypothetical protein
MILLSGNLVPDDFQELCLNIRFLFYVWDPLHLWQRILLITDPHKKQTTKPVSSKTEAENK